MSRHSTTYRLFTLFTAIFLAVSISLPSIVVASVYCDMEMQQSPTTTASDKQCMLMAYQSNQNNSDQLNPDSQNTNCSWTLTCEITQTDLTNKTIPTVNKKAVQAFVVSIVDFIDTESVSIPTFLADAERNQQQESPPLFLLNSTFLN
ncbi:hypothetical protein [Fodinibius halophilus]|uniref:Uncharacterized protein n=1 Tax=Fodinibius halophilus TaxID=1736908 RepID=A0A6M1T4T6_9BACT|nr:hypothetical protein [Fodinibius halophilus]NGP87693.1 hypothetical protein [Fodinibius halophilus]